MSASRLQVKGEPAVLATAHDTSEEMALSDGRAEIRRQQGILEERERSGAEIRRWADAVDAAAFGIAIIEPASARVAYANPAYMAMHGAAGDVAGGMSFAQVYHETEVDRVRSLLAAADSTGQAIVFEARRLRKDGSSYPAQVTLTSVRGPDGEISYRFVSVVDISDLKRTQEALRHAQKMEAIGNVTGGMAHDFNNLLGIIIGNLDLIGPLLQADRTGSEYLRETVDAALRGADLTRRLLAGMARLLARLLGDDIRISVGLAPATWPVVVDRPWFEASIANLATNARDAMPRGGTLHLSTSNRRVGDGDASLHAGLRPGDYVLIEVSDSGVGIAPEMMSTIFEPFFTTKDTGRGTGLGLSMVFGFTRQSGGTVTVHSEPGHGATFCLFLPRAVQAPMASRSRKQVGALRGRGEVVLVVEDNPAMRRTVARQLADLGYAVISSGDGRDALKVLESARVDLLFSDIVMPGGIDGIGLARLALERHPRTAVLLTSAFPEGRLNGQMRKLGAALGFLKKPYRHHALARAVRDAIDGHEAAARPQSRTG